MRIIQTDTINHHVVYKTFESLTASKRNFHSVFFDKKGLQSIQVKFVLRKQVQIYALTMTQT